MVTSFNARAIRTAGMDQGSDRAGWQKGIRKDAERLQCPPLALPVGNACSV
jgi:hypothetical protein